MKVLGILFVISCIFVIYDSQVFAATETKSMDAGVNIDFTYPDTVFAGRNFTVTALVKNNGWEDKQDIKFEFSTDEQKITSKIDAITIEKISSNGQIGKSIDYHVSDKITPGTYYVNVKYSQVLLANNKDPQEPFNSNFAFPIIVKEQPGIIIHTTAPESIFTNAEFPFDVEVLSNDIDISDVTISVIPPSDIIFRGEKQHTYSKISKGESIFFSSQIVTDDEEVTTEHTLPFEVKVSYHNDVQEQKTDTQVTKVVLRPRSMMEITADGGIWIGGFFLAPYVSIGTIVGIPAGTIFSLLIKKAQKQKSKRKSKK